MSTSTIAPPSLQDLEVALPGRPGALADLGEALGRAGVSLEGGGVTTVAGRTVAHFLVDDGPRALAAVAATGLGPAATRDVVMTRLDQDVPGQMGAFARRLGDAEVPVQHLYSDHDGHLVLLVDDAHAATCRAVVRAWDAERDGARPAR
ncbi:hypothetical protein [Isoptericola sp. NPDC055881]